MRTVVVAILLLTGVALVGACGGGGGDANPQTTAPPAPDPPTTPDPPPMPDPEPQPPVVSPACVESVIGCLVPERYEAERRTIADAHSGEVDFKNQWGLTSIRADTAYAQLQLEHGIDRDAGSGQTVGLIDTGIDAGHPVFAGKTISEHLFDEAQDETGEEFSHGTAVASVIAARRGAVFDYAGASPAHGVAWGADIAMLAIPTGSGGGTYVPIQFSGQTSADDRWANRVTHMNDWSIGGRRLDFVNVSVGYHGIIDQYGEQEIRESFGGMIEALAQAGTDDKTVFVWSAGNAHGNDCDAIDFENNPDLCVDGRIDAKSVELQPGLPARIAELRGHLIAVVAVAPDNDGDGDNEIADFSNRCGIAKDWCIAAPGEDVRVAYFGPYEGTAGARLNANVSGTSVAAPMVTGALVVMKDYFRDELYNTDLVARLLATADKDGIYADTSVYGQGLLDLAAATTPAGTPGIALGPRVDGTSVGLSATRLGLGKAFGDGLARALAGREIVAFDALGAPFWYALGSLTAAADGPFASARLRRFMAQPLERQEPGHRRPTVGATESGEGDGKSVPLRLGLLESQESGNGSGHLSLAGRAPTVGAAGKRGLSIAAFSTEGLDGRAPVSGATLALRPKGVPLGVHSGLVGEREGLLGSSAAGAFGHMAAASAFAGVEAGAHVGQWRIGVNAEIGTVNASVQGGLIADVSPLATSAFALQATRSFPGESTLTLSLSQPLRVEAGRARLSVPVGRTKDGLVRHHSMMADLEPTGRQIDVTVQWREPLTAGSELRLGAAWTRHPGHAASANPDLTVLAGWQHTF